MIQFSQKQKIISNKTSVTDLDTDERERGQAMVEYLIVLSIALAVAIPLSKNLLIYLDGTIARMGATLEQKLYTGKVKVTAWKN